MRREVRNQGDPIGIALTFLDDNGAPYDAAPTFAAINPNGKKIPIDVANVEHVGTGQYTAWYSSRSMAGQWDIEAYGATSSDPVGKVGYTVLPTRVNG